MRSMGKSWYQSPIKSAAGRILCFWSGTKIIGIEANGYPGLAVFDPSTGEVRSDEPELIDGLCNPPTRHATWHLMLLFPQAN